MRAPNRQNKIAGGYEADSVNLVSAKKLPFAGGAETYEGPVRATEVSPNYTSIVRTTLSEIKCQAKTFSLTAPLSGASANL